MTVSTTNTEVSYTADGVQTNFPFNFQVQLPTDIQVWVDNSQLFVGFVVNLNADQEVSPGGSVDITPAPADQSDVTVRRVVPLTQETDYEPYDPFPAETHEDALDKLTMITQQLAADKDNTLVWVDPPQQDTDPGVAGQVAYDNGHFYVCVATNDWKRVAFTGW